jgi:hypothetical protein
MQDSGEDLYPVTIRGRAYKTWFVAERRPRLSVCALTAGNVLVVGGGLTVPRSVAVAVRVVGLIWEHGPGRHCCAGSAGSLRSDVFDGGGPVRLTLVGPEAVAPDRWRLDEAARELRIARRGRVATTLNAIGAADEAWTRWVKDRSPYSDAALRRLHVVIAGTVWSVRRQVPGKGGGIHVPSRTLFVDDGESDAGANLALGAMVGATWELSAKELPARTRDTHERLPASDAAAVVGDVAGAAARLGAPQPVADPVACVLDLLRRGPAAPEIT